MADLNDTIRKRQDELRGRPEDWIDRLSAQIRGRDWTSDLLWLFVLLWTVCIVGFGLWLVAGR